MPKAKRTTGRKPPAGWTNIEPTLETLDRRMRDAETSTLPGKENGWNILRINHQRSRYVYDMYHKRKLISKKLYEYCLERGICDKSLAKYWSRNGYERLCCVRCVAKDSSFGSSCICRVPSAMRSDAVDDDTQETESDGAEGSEQKNIPKPTLQCNHCGCKGCASSD